MRLPNPSGELSGFDLNDGSHTGEIGALGVDQHRGVERVARLRSRRDHDRVDLLDRVRGVRSRERSDLQNRF